MKITGGQLHPDEAHAYREHAKQHYPGYELTGLHIVSDNEIELEMRPIPFERVRRITGYLTGTTARWNEAKQAELKDRISHNFRCPTCQPPYNSERLLRGVVGDDVDRWYIKDGYRHIPTENCPDCGRRLID